MFSASEARAAALDDLLWTFRQDSFVPHERYPLVGRRASPVLVGTAAPATVDAQVLINPNDAPAEGVSSATSGGGTGGSASRGAGAIRERFRQYREQGCARDMVNE